MAKSLDEIWQKIQEDKESSRLKEKQEQELAEENARQKRMEWVRKNELYESLRTNSLSNNSISSSSGTSVGKYITFKDTIWIYPKDEVEWAIQNSGINFQRIGNQWIFNDINEFQQFYDTAYVRTSVTQPIGNEGYSLGVNTILQGSREQIYFKLVDGSLVAIWMLFKQLTSQSELPSGGNSPDGTIGYGIIFNDYDTDGVQDDINSVPPGYLDPLRIKKLI